MPFKLGIIGLICVISASLTGEITLAEDIVSTGVLKPMVIEVETDTGAVAQYSIVEGANDYQLVKNGSSTILMSNHTSGTKCIPTYFGSTTKDNVLQAYTDNGETKPRNLTVPKGTYLSGRCDSKTTDLRWFILKTPSIQFTE